MADHIEPTQTEFNDIEQIIIDTLNKNSPGVMTKVGSVIRELVIRPISYIVSWATANLQDKKTKYSIVYLKTSQEKDNDTADAVAYNYFVTRRQGTRSKGIITLTLNSPVTRIPSGASFTIGSDTVQTESQIVVLTGDITNDIPGVVYVRAIQLNDTEYIANIPVTATAVGSIEIPVGYDVTVNFTSTAIVQAELTSAITGGTDTETDASLMRRAEYNTAESGIGTYYGLLKKFNNAPVYVQSIFPVSGEDYPLFRARYNSVNINPGGFVDCYVKTSNQPTTDLIPVSLTKTSTESDESSAVTFSGEITDSKCAGLFGIDRIIAESVVVNTYSVSFSSSDASFSADGARLSTKQKVIITVTLPAGSADNVTKIDAAVSVSYMPNLTELQQYIEGDKERFIGQDICVKAAVPVLVTLECGVVSNKELSEADLDLLKQTITGCVNDTPVGAGTLNFSDIRKACQQAIAGVDLRLPCVMHAVTYLKDGTTDTFYSNTGILDITDAANKAYWSHEMCFFSTCKDKVRLEVL